MWAYDVYLSFRGEDTRLNFTNHLYNSLIQKGIRAFKDNELLGSGEEMSHTIHKETIEKSRIFLIILSENYASSTWCLDELAGILQCRKSKEQIVIPVFYKVDPSHVRNQTGSYAEAFERHQSRFKDNREKVLRWRTTLHQVANLSGFAFDDYGHESKLIHTIIKEICLKVLNRAYLDVATYPIGIWYRVNEIIELLGSGVNDVRFIGIWGIGGIGKTTLAKDVYNSIAHKFEGSCFLENVRENSMERGGLVQQQNILLSQITRDAMLEVTTIDKGVNMIRKSLRHKRVLLILDDVNQFTQLNKLAGGSRWFGMGSRIIITTRSKNLLKAHQVDEIYKVKELDHSKSVELLRWNAFPEKRLPDDYVELANAIVGYAKGNPLDITVMGSDLRDRSIDEWQAELDSYKRATNLEMIEENAPVNMERHQVIQVHKESTVLIENRANLLGWAFLLFSLLLEFASIGFDYASSPSNPQYAIYGMVCSSVATLACICEFGYKIITKEVKWRWWKKYKFWWLLYPGPNDIPFGHVPDFYGLIGGISQWISSILKCHYRYRPYDNPFTVSLLPPIFLICLCFSRWNEKKRVETLPR